MKVFEVELNITQTFRTTVLVAGDFKDKKDLAIDELAKRTADNMDHDHWDYADTEFEVFNINESSVLQALSEHRKILISFGYSLDKVKSFSDEEAESELQAIGYLK